MFKKRKKYLYQQILQADTRACQVRTLDGRILYTNPKGTFIFGLKEDPFVAFQNNKEDSNLYELTRAYKQYLPFETILKNQERIFEIKLTPLDNALLITATDKTSAQKTYQALEHQLDVLSETIRNITAPIFLSDIHQTILYANPAFIQEFHLDLAQLIGRNYLDFFHNHKPKGWDIININAGNEDLILGIKKIKWATQVSSDTEDSPIPTIIIEPKTKKIIGINNAFSCAFDKNLNEVIDTDFTKLWDSVSQNQLNEIYSKLNANKIDSLTYDLTTYSGEEHFRSMWGKQNNKWTCYLFDITPRKKLELQLAQDQKMQALGQLTGGIAHDFNNILTAIIGFTDLLLEKHPSNDPLFSDIMQIKGNAQKAASLVGQLLTFSRKTPIQNKLISVHDALVDLTPLLQRSLAPLSTLKLDIKRNLGCIRLAPNQLTQILLNLAVNAKDAMKEGGILKINVSREEVKKQRPFANTTLPVGDYIKITASDTGSGIPANLLPHIFDPFFTTKEKTQQSGTGLGLSTVYGIINSAGGFIKVDSEQNIGTTFTILLPRFEEEKVAENSVQRSIPQIFLPQQSGKIVLADDEDGIRLVIKRALTVKGFQVIECQNATQAIDAVKSNPDVQLLITDMMMPGMDGEHLIQNVKQLNPTIKAILMSGYSNQFEKHTANTPLPFTFLTKPFVLDELLRLVQKVLQN